jgi:transposase InsO family protein
MKLHANARTCPKSRALIARRVLVEGWTLAAAAEAAGVSVVTARKWVRRFEGGDRRLRDRSSRPRRSPRRLGESLVCAIESLRRLRMTAAEIAEVLGLALSTVSLWLRRIGLGKRSRLEPAQPSNRYERSRAGELVHIDIKQLGKISVRGAGHRIVGHRQSQVYRRIDGRQRQLTGYEFVHVAVDDHSRLAYAEVLDDLTAACAIAFLRRALDWFAERGVRVEAIMTDNGSAYVSHAHRAACDELGLRHHRIKPGRPRTNGKAERFIRTLRDQWAWGRIYGSSHERAAALPHWLNHYNYRRPHSSLGHQPPATRINNLPGSYN